MKKLLVGISFVAVIGLLGVSRSEAAGAARGAKANTAVNYTVTVTTIAVGPAALYSVITGTGAAPGDFVAVFDSAPTFGNALNSGNIGSGANLKIRLYSVGLSSQTVINFDPPLQFNNGIIAAPAAATGAYLFVFEKGRVTQGY